MRDRPISEPGSTTAHGRGIVYACGSVALFSSFVIVSRLGLTTSLALPDIAALRFGISALVLSPVLLKHGIGQLHPSQAIALGLLGGLAFALLAYAGFALAPVAHSAIALHGTLSLTTAYLLSLLSPSGRRDLQRVGLGVIVLGVGMATWDGLAHASIGLLLGDICLLLASLCWSGYGIYVRRLGLPAPHAAAIVAAVSALLFLPVYAMLPGTHLLRASWPDLLIQAIFQGLLTGVVSILVYTRAVALLGPTKVSIFTTAVPAVTTMAGLALLGERPGVPILAGVALVTLGALISLRDQIRTCVPISTTRLEGIEK
ncbi:DMT family transporter [Labrys okinawensis]|uniref:DMT family transporter n=1 Tax=Labrys okinawensis TaxID=346911 RepID=UPI0039BC6C26